MAKNFSVVVYNNNDVQPVVSGNKIRSIGQLVSFYRGLAGGAHRAAVTMDCRNDGVQASGTITIASGSGTLTATINGVAITATWATSDTNSAALLAAAINNSSNALVKNIVSASSAAGVVTITAKVPGIVGNCITLAASGTGATASGTRLTGGSETLITFNF